MCHQKSSSCEAIGASLALTGHPGWRACSFRSKTATGTWKDPNLRLLGLSRIRYFSKSTFCVRPEVSVSTLCFPELPQISLRTPRTQGSIMNAKGEERL